MIMARKAASELESCDALFITDDNLAAGFAKHFESSPFPNLKTILTQATLGAPPTLPVSFKRISFDPAETAEKAVLLLKELKKAGLDGIGDTRSYVKPALEK